MTVKVRDAGGVLRTVDVLKVRDAAGVLRTIDFIKVRGSDNVLREVFRAGGTPAPGNPGFISPGSSRTRGSAAAYSTYFTAQSSGAAPSAYSWGVLDGIGSIVSGANEATAQLRITVNTPGDDGEATFYCDMTIGGTVYRATCTMYRYREMSTGPLQ